MRAKSGFQLLFWFLKCLKIGPEGRKIILRGPKFKELDFSDRLLGPIRAKLS
jgi:hypothetical protein